MGVNNEYRQAVDNREKDISVCGRMWVYCEYQLYSVFKNVYVPLKALDLSLTCAVLLTAISVYMLYVKSTNLLYVCMHLDFTSFFF